MDDCERTGPKPELGLVGLNDVERSQPVAPLVLDEGAVGALQRPCQSPQRDATTLTATAEGQSQTSLRSRLGDLHPRPTLHVPIPLEISDPIVHSSEAFRKRWGRLAVWCGSELTLCLAPRRPTSSAHHAQWPTLEAHGPARHR